MASGTATRRPSDSGGVLKRLLVGRAMSSHRLEHTLLPKVLALPVFASDALSSVAYATGEIMVVLLSASLASKQYVVPITLAVACVMAIVVSSYRQTVRAYPSGGGAYIVSKDNLGVLPGLVAAAALLVDYLMTVVVSIVAGVFAIGSALPWANDHRVVLSIAFVWFVTLLNLRGARESGTLFAIPTYGFVLAILTMVGLGLIKCVGGCPATEGVEPIHTIATAAGPISVFVILRAFASGSTALTGVEAISNGVPAFRRPQARNAAETLTIMAAIAITMFVGISWLATHIEGVTASDERSVPAQIAWAVFDGGAGFYVVQFFTAAILILAANTAYQDFPRLSAILARDRYMPRQFMNRGDRLVFSNGIVVLAILSSLMIYGFDADLTALLHLYVIGVFTSFTLSQSGMVVHWLRERHKGEDAAGRWRRSIVINAVGATATGVVLVVVTVTKFAVGGWISITAMALLVPIFYSIHRHYSGILEELRRGRVTVGGTGLNHVVLLVTGLDDATAEAVGYVRSIRPTDLRAVYPTVTGLVPAELQERWRRLAVGAPDLEPLPIKGGDLLGGMRAFVRGIAGRHRDFVTVVIPEIVRDGSLVSYLLGHRALVRLKAGLLREQNVVVADVPFRSGARVAVAADGRPLIPSRTVALVFVSAIHDATVRAVNYAMSLEASETRAVYFDMDPEQDYQIEREWAEKGL
ncbi:MAG TPA: APC family permease, partial [Actinomycetota bacterium]|nr:APC family permease [Actinomycetota bacterium]